jgi:hypothetical protein
VALTKIMNRIIVSPSVFLIGRAVALGLNHC